MFAAGRMVFAVLGSRCLDHFEILGVSADGTPNFLCKKLEQKGRHIDERHNEQRAISGLVHLSPAVLSRLLCPMGQWSLGGGA